jgi:hypothetical protein
MGEWRVGNERLGFEVQADLACSIPARRAAFVASPCTLNGHRRDHFRLAALSVSLEPHPHAHRCVREKAAITGGK